MREVGIVVRLSILGHSRIGFISSLFKELVCNSFRLFACDWLRSPIGEGSTESPIAAWNSEVFAVNPVSRQNS